MRAPSKKNGAGGFAGVCAVSFFFWAVEDQRCGEALELGGHGHRNPPRCHADTRSDLDHDSGIPLQISTEIRTMYPNHVKRWGPHPERCPRLSRQAGQQGILTEPHMISILLMEEKLHQLGCISINPCKSWDICHINWCRISEPSTIWCTDIQGALLKSPTIPTFP